MTVFEQVLEASIEGIRKKLSWQFRNKRYDGVLKLRLSALEYILESYLKNDKENANLDPNNKCPWT